MKVHVESFKSHFLSPKKQKNRQPHFVWNFLQSPIQACRFAHFKINAPIFCYPFIFDFRNLRSGSTKWQMNILSITTLVFRINFKDTPCHISMEFYRDFSRIFLEFFLKPIYPTIVMEKFQIYGVKITGIKIHCDSKIESVHFCSCPQANLYPSQKEINHFTRTAFSENLFFPQKKEGRIIDLKKWPKLDLRGYWSQVLINSIIFAATFTFLVSILLCHNLNSSIL